MKMRPLIQKAPLRRSSAGERYNGVAVALFGAALYGCPAGEVADPPASVAPAPATASAPAAAAPGAPRPVPAGERKPPFASPPWRIPVGPSLPIVPGEGFGPIRFGARVDTIERLIGEPCEEKREEAGGRLICRYSAQAVEFVLEGGVVKQMRAYRMGRPFKPEPKLDFGIFNGRFVEGAAFGMLQSGVQELLGKPKAVRPVEGENPNQTVEVHEYPGFSLEYDRLGPERVVLGGVILDAPPAAPSAASARPTAPAAKKP